MKNISPKKRVAILGFGNEGRAVLKFIKKDKAYKDAEVWILDRSASAKIPRGLKAKLGKDYLSDISSFDIIFRSPGVPYMSKELVAARRKGVRFSSATKLFFERSGAAIIGVTGTKGKGTTSTLLHKILKAAGKKVLLAGNIGTPAVSVLPKLTKNSLVILELSSFQLQDLEISPKISAVLDVFPDHQDSHKNLKEYYESKANVARHQRPTDAVFFFGDRKMSGYVAQGGKGKKKPIFPEEFSEFDEEELKVKGPHNFRNAVLAAAVAEYLGVPKKTVIKTIKNFRGLEHRLEFVRSIGNVSFYNDSASTNPQTSSAALRSFPGEDSAIILGGYDKGLDYAPVARAIKETKPKLVILLGANKEKIRESIKKSGAEIVDAKDLYDAVRMAYSKLKGKETPGAVIFSPGAASFDMFRNYVHRGEEFRKTVKALKN